MSEMLEKVARALFDVEHREMQWSESAAHAEWMRALDYWMDAARAAVEALREPSEGMVKAAEVAVDDMPDARNWWEMFRTGYWATFDHVLKES